MQQTYKERLLGNTPACIKQAIEWILQGNPRFHSYFQEISTYNNSNEIYKDIFIILLDNLYSPHAKYVIRKLFVISHNLSLYIARELEKILGSQQNAIDTLLIDYQDYNACKVYKNIRHIHEINVGILKQIGAIYHNYTITPNIQNIIYLCDGDEIIMELFRSNKSLWLPMLKHMIYTKNKYVINWAMYTPFREELVKMIQLLNEPYNEDDLIRHTRNMNIVARKVGYSNPWTIPIAFPSSIHLYQCLVSLLDYNTIAHIAYERVHLKYLKFFEFCCDKATSFIDEPYYTKDILHVNYVILTKVLSRKCLTKRMLKFGNPASSDNLNERHLVDLIVTFIV